MAKTRKTLNAMQSTHRHVMRLVVRRLEYKCFWGELQCHSIKTVLHHNLYLCCFNLPQSHYYIHIIKIETFNICKQLPLKFNELSERKLNESGTNIAYLFEQNTLFQ